MRTLRTSTITAMTAALALVAAAIPFGGVATGLIAGAPQAAVVTEASTAPVSAGTLTLGTGGNGANARAVVEWEGLRQEFNRQPPCILAMLPESDNLLEIRGYIGNLSSSAGFNNGDIGVYEFKVQDGPPWNAAQCSQVDAGSFTKTETLGLDLGSDAVDYFGPLTATSATVSLVAKSKTGSILATLVDAEGAPVGTRSITWKNWSINLGGAFTGDFSGIRLTAKDGGFSLRGASFDLVSTADGELGCEETATPIAAEGTDPGVTVTRLGNADPAEACELIPYKLRTGDQEVQFLKPLDEQVSAQFILDFVWTVSPANTGDVGAALLPETTIDYEQGGGELPLRWCPDVITDGAGTPTGIVDVLTNDAAEDQEPTLDGKQFTCIITQNSTVSDGNPDYVTIDQQVYLLGDAVYRFR